VYIYITYFGREHNDHVLEKNELEGYFVLSLIVLHLSESFQKVFKHCDPVRDS